MKRKFSAEPNDTAAPAYKRQFTPSTGGTAASSVPEANQPIKPRVLLPKKFFSSIPTTPKQPPSQQLLASPKTIGSPSQIQYSKTKSPTTVLSPPKPINKTYLETNPSNSANHQITTTTNQTKPVPFKLNPPVPPTKILPNAKPNSNSNQQIIAPTCQTKLVSIQLQQPTSQATNPSTKLDSNSIWKKKIENNENVVNQQTASPPNQTKSISIWKPTNPSTKPFSNTKFDSNPVHHQQITSPVIQTKSVPVSPSTKHSTNTTLHSNYVWGNAVNQQIITTTYQTKSVPVQQPISQSKNLFSSSKFHILENNGNGNVVNQQVIATASVNQTKTVSTKHIASAAQTKSVPTSPSTNLSNTKSNSNCIVEIETNQITVNPQIIAIAPVNQTKLVSTKQSTLNHWIQHSVPPALVPSDPKPKQTNYWENSWGRSHQKQIADCPFYKRVPKTNFIVDGFKHIYSQPENPIFFLSHFHSDHYGGLVSKFNRGLILGFFFIHEIDCSQITANLVQLKLGVDKQYLRPLEMNTPTTVQNALVTLFEANHCPGAVMFLFQIDGQSHLHTGDFRYLRTLEDHRFLSQLNLTYLFLDTTYLDPKHCFPLQEEVVEACLGELGKVIGRADTIVVFGTYTIGKERLFIAAAQRFKCKIFVTPAKLKIIRCLNYPDSVLQLFTTQPQHAKIHVAPMKEINYSDLEKYCNARGWPIQSIVGVKPTGWTFSGSPTETMKKKTKGNVTIYDLPYSEHSSFAELRSFVRSMNAKKIVATVDNHKLPPGSVECALGLVDRVSSPVASKLPTAASMIGSSSVIIFNNNIINSNNICITKSHHTKKKIYKGHDNVYVIDD